MRTLADGHPLRVLMVALAVVAAVAPAPASAVACSGCPLEYTVCTSHERPADSCCGQREADRAQAASGAAERSPDSETNRTGCSAHCPLSSCRVVQPASRLHFEPSGDDTFALITSAANALPASPVADAIFHPPRI